MDDLYQAFIDRVVLAFGRRSSPGGTATSSTTRGWTARRALAVYSGFRLKFSQTGTLPNYAFAIILGVVALAIVAMTVFV